VSANSRFALSPDNINNECGLKSAGSTSFKKT
jgi:hypothetical protein